MTTLWLSFAVLTLVAMAFVAVPMLRARTSAVVIDGVTIRRDKNREVFLQRRQELDEELQQGIVSPEDHGRMLTELQRAFLHDMQELAPNPGRHIVYSKALPLIMVLLIPVLSFGFYHQWGSAADLALPQLLSEVRNAPDEAAQLAALNQLADQLQLRFDRHSDDLQNGYMLGTLYLELERFAEATQVFRDMLDQMQASPDRATVLGQLAQAEYMRNDSRINATVQGVIDEALALNPNEYAVMSILAIDAFLKEDLVGAVGYWRRQLSASEPGSPQSKTLRERIAAVEAYMPQEQRDALVGATITVQIDISDELKAQLGDFTSLFVYARNPAMPMPIVAQNLPVPEFPFTITLDNSLSMTGMQLESVPQLLLGARLSKTGVANRASGDLQTESAPFELKTLDGPVTLLIDQVVP